MADRIKSFQQETNQINILKSIRTDLGATASSYTPDTSVVTKDRVVTYAQAEEELSVLGDIEEGVKQQVADLDIAQKDIKNIKSLLQGNLYDYQTDSSSAYTKTVPAGAMPYASLDSIGGKTLVWNQTFVLSILRADATSYGVTSEKTANGIRLYGAFTSAINLPVFNSWYDAIIGHKYLIANTPVAEPIALRLTQNGGYVNWQENTPFTATDTHTYLAIRAITTGVTFDVTWTPQIFDLTLMFGAGNEPTTYAEFQQMFPADYYPYNAGELLSAGVTEVESRHKTVVWNQLVVTGNRTSEKNGITYTITSDGTVVINGTSTAIADFAPTFFSTDLTIGHVYWLRGCPADSSVSTYYLNTNNGACYADGLRFTAYSSTSRVIHIRVESGVTANNVTFKVQCTDLTLMFGAGNEPTLEECRTMFPADYPYNAGTEIPLSVAIKDGVDVALQTPIVLRDYPIPAEVRALSGYGWSCPSHYNYIDFEAKKFVQNVGSRAYASGDESDATVITDGTTTYYPLNPVIETDISAYLTDDNLIEVEPNGTLTFPNSNGTDYQIPVPSAETYMVDLQSAL